MLAPTPIKPSYQSPLLKVLFYDDIVHEFGEITQKIRAITPFKVIQGHRFWY